MNNNDIINIFIGLGWTGSKDETGMQYCEISLGEISLSNMPRLRSLGDRKVLELNYSISSPLFTKTVSDITGFNSTYQPIIVHIERVREVDFSREDIIAIERKIINWGKSQSLDHALTKLREEALPSLGQGQVYHLAALALAGNVHKLVQYQTSFEQGETLDFVPMIEKEWIDRTVNIAKSITET